MASVPLLTSRTCSTGSTRRDDLLGEEHLVLAGGAVAEPVRGRLLHRREDVGVGVAQDHRAPRADQVDVLATVGVGEVGALGADHEPGRAAHGAERAHRAVDPSRGDRGAAVQQDLGGGGVVRVGRHAPIVSAAAL